MPVSLPINVKHSSVPGQPDTVLEMPLYRWVNEASLFLAEEADLEAERKALAEAMAVSLSEEEDRKAAKVPLKEWANDSLLAHFCESTVVKQVFVYLLSIGVVSCQVYWVILRSCSNGALCMAATRMRIWFRSSLP